MNNRSKSKVFFYIDLSNKYSCLTPFHLAFILSSLLSSIFIPLLGYNNPGRAQTSAAQIPVTKHSFNIFTNSIDSIITTILYPSTWRIDKTYSVSDNITTPYIQLIKVVHFIKDYNTFSGDFIIAIYDLSNNIIYNDEINLTRFIKDTIDYYKEYYYTDFNLTEFNNNTLLSGNNAYKLVWTDREGSYLFRTLQMVSLIDKKIYIVQYYAESNKYSSNLPIIETMIDSLRINRPK